MRAKGMRETDTLLLRLQRRKHLLARTLPYTLPDYFVVSVDMLTLHRPDDGFRFPNVRLWSLQMNVGTQTYTPTDPGGLE